jgi:hypothetical protein
VTSEAILKGSLQMASTEELTEVRKQFARHFLTEG